MPDIDLSLMSQAFSARYSPSLASFSERPEKVDVLTEDGNAVDLEALAAEFKQFEALRHGNSVQLPLHKPESAELTGEFVLFTEEDRRTIVEYHWSMVNRDDFQSVRQAGMTEIGWRLRFWTDAFDVPATPSYMPSGDTQEEESVLELVPEKLTADHWGEQRRDDFFTHLLDFVTAEKQRDRRDSTDSRARRNTDDRRISHWISEKTLHYGSGGSEGESDEGSQKNSRKTNRENNDTARLRDGILEDWIIGKNYVW